MRQYSNCLLDPSDAVMLLIDEQPQMFFGVENAPRCSIMNSVAGLAKTAKVFNVPCILTTVTAKTFAGSMYSKLLSIFPDVAPIDRTNINAWEDPKVKQAVTDTGRKTLIIAGLWTEACVTFPALSAIAEDYTVYVVADACGGASKTAHKMAMQRMIQAGVRPVTWEQVLLEFQRDWNNKDTYNAVMQIIKEHGGTYGIGVEYAEEFR